MNLDKLGSYIKELEDVIAKIKEEGTCILAPQAFQILNIRENDFSYVHFWDPRNPEPRILCSIPKTIEIGEMTKILMKALDMLGPKSTSYGVEWIGDVAWDKLPEHYIKLDQVLPVTKLQMKKDHKEYIKGREYALYNLPSELPVQSSDRGDVQQDWPERLSDL